MSLTSGPINETEQAAEKAADHIGAAIDSVSWASGGFLAPQMYGQAPDAL